MIKTSIAAAVAIALTFLGLYHAGLLCDEIDPAKVARSRCDREQLAQDVRLFLGSEGRLPANLYEIPHVLSADQREFRGYQRDREPLDPWNTPYRLEATDSERGFRVVGYGEKTRRWFLEQHRIRFAPILPLFETTDAYFVYFFALLAVPLALLFLIKFRWPPPGRRGPAALRISIIVVMLDVAAVGLWSSYVMIAQFLAAMGDL